MKKIFLIATFLFSFNQALAQDWPYATPESGSSLPSVSGISSIKTKSPDLGFFYKHFFTIDYSAPVISDGGANSRLKTSDDIFHQIRDIENIALGQHFRIHKFLGLQWNWAQTDLDNTAFRGVGALSRKANFRMDQYNFSALFFVPVEPNLFEIFAELGVSDMHSKLNYATADGSFFQQKNHETNGIYGLGFQINPDKNSEDAVRFSVQKYSGKLSLLDSHYTTVRIGYLKKF